MSFFQSEIYDPRVHLYYNFNFSAFKIFEAPGRVIFFTFFILIFTPSGASIISKPQASCRVYIRKAAVSAFLNEGCPMLLPMSSICTLLLQYHVELLLQYSARFSYGTMSNCCCRTMHSYSYVQCPLVPKYAANYCYSRISSCTYRTGTMSSYAYSTMPPTVALGYPAVYKTRCQPSVKYEIQLPLEHGANFFYSTVLATVTVQCPLPVFVTLCCTGSTRQSIITRRLTSVTEGSVSSPYLIQHPAASAVQGTEPGPSTLRSFDITQMPPRWVRLKSLSMILHCALSTGRCSCRS